MPRILVTGGAGFIGCNFVRHVLTRGTAEVAVLDKLTYAGHPENLADVADDPRYLRPGGGIVVEGDIADRPAVRELLRELRPTTVVNFAAESHVDRSIDGPGEFIRTNVVGTFELLEAVRHYFAELPAGERRGFRFLHVSTDEVYGSLGETGLFSETTPYAPNSPYAASKAAADHLVRAYFHTYDLPTLITNCSNNYGPYQYPEKLIPLMILNALDGKDLPIYGQGDNVRDWIYVDDHCAGVLLVLERGRLGEKYNLGGHNERTNLEVVDRICDLLQELVPPAENPALAQRSLARYHDLKEFVQDRPGHDWRYAIDSSKVRAELGWRARHDFESGLRETVRWYAENTAWCEAVTGHHDHRQRLGLGCDGRTPTTP